MNVISRNNSMIIILWGLIISKCLTLEYLIQVYSIPINSLFYIWTLTLVMAIVATATFLNTKNIRIGVMENISIVHACWFTCAVVGLLSIVFFAVSGQLKLNRLMIIPTIIIGCGYLVHGISMKKNMLTTSGIGWWIGAAVLATRDTIESLAILAFLIILLTLLPLILEMRQNRTGFF